MVGGTVVCVASGAVFSTIGGRRGPSARARGLGADGVAGRSVLVSGGGACLGGDGAGSRGGVSTACGAGGLVVSAARSLLGSGFPSVGMMAAILSLRTKAKP